MPVLKNKRYERFAQELAKGKSASEAYSLAGYVPDDSNCIKLKNRPEIIARVDEILGKAAKRAEISVESVLRELALIGFANMGDYMRVGHDGDPCLDFSNLTRDQAAALVEVTVEDFKEGRGEEARDVRRVKFKLADKKGALVDLGRHLGMFKDKVEHSGPEGGPIRSEVDISSLTPEQMAAIASIRIAGE